MTPQQRTTIQVSIFYLNRYADMIEHNTRLLQGYLKEDLEVLREKVLKTAQDLSTLDTRDTSFPSE